MKTKKNITNLFNEAKLNGYYLKVCAPMVRYSKVHFRSLVRNYGVDLTFTPMIMADSFCQNKKARSNEFLTTRNDAPLIVQFAAKNVEDFVDASILVSPYADGVDLNCGCPQRWAMKDGYGCALLSQPEIIDDLVKAVKNKLHGDFSVSVKIRILKDLKRTIDLCQKLEKCGASFLTVHGRTPTQKGSEEIDINALSDISKSLRIPFVANGGVKNLNDAELLYNSTKCDGVMVASGILTNPALFTGVSKTPLQCVKQWMDIKDWDLQNINFQCYHHHLVFMLEKILTRKQKQVFNYLNTFEEVDDFIREFVFQEWTPCVSNYVGDEIINCEFNDEITLKHSNKCRGCGRSTCYCICDTYDCNLTSGTYYSSYIMDYEDVDYMESNMFLEPL